MAASDFVVADRTITSLTAGDKVNETVYANPDTEAAAAALAAHVTNAAYVGYSAALNAHQARADIETLADRRAREISTTFAAADFMRAQVYNADGTVRAAPRAGSVKGDADKSS